MRSALIAALPALAALAMISVAATAQTDQRDANPSYGPANHAATSDGTGLTAQQENEIPYHPCTEAIGWENGRLRCRNN
jgi:hypothetical protein